MRFQLIEEILNEGKNIQKTFDQFRDKILKAAQDSRNPFVLPSNVDQHMMRIIKLDPTYVEGSDVTGDFGVWLLNQQSKNNLKKFEDENNISITSLLQDFIEKKSNLANKDINSYKTPQALFDILSQTVLTDRQKERKLRKNIDGAKHIGSTANFDIYIPETYEASCALGKGSGWCTADSRTSQYYDYYKDKFGGDYYIAISKDGKYKYQLHFESGQFSAAGTNADINEPNEEKMLDLSDLARQWPEITDFFTEKLKDDPVMFINSLLDQMDIPQDLDYYLEIDELLKLKNTGILRNWAVQDPDDIPSIRVQNAIMNNKEVFMKWMGIVNKRDKKQLLSIEELQECSYKAFKHRYSQRLRELKSSVNSDSKMEYLRFDTVNPNFMRFYCKRLDVAKAIMDSYISTYIEECIEKGDTDSIIEQLQGIGLEYSDGSPYIIGLFEPVIKSDLEYLPDLLRYYFANQRCQFFFFENFEDEVMDAVDDKLIAGALEDEDTE